MHQNQTGFCLRMLCLWILLAMTPGCGGKAGGGGELARSFEKSEPAAKATAEQAEAAVKAEKYEEAVARLGQLLSEHTLTSAQTQAVRSAFGEIVKTVSTRPNLDNAGFFKARSRLMEQLYGQ